MSNPDNNFDFAGAGFVLLSLDIGTTSSGSLTDGSGFQPLSNITFDGTTGATSFAVAESPTIGVRNIKFSGNVINDGSGNAIGFTGTWQGIRVPVIVEEFSDSRCSERTRQTRGTCDWRSSSRVF